MALKALKPARESSVELDDLLAGDRPLTVHFENGSALETTYNPRLVTGELLATVHRAQRPDAVPGDAIPVVVSFLNTILTSWTLARKGKEIPISETTLMGLPIQGILVPIANAIEEDMTPHPTPATN